MEVVQRRKRIKKCICVVCCADVDSTGKSETLLTKCLIEHLHPSPQSPAKNDPVGRFEVFDFCSECTEIVEDLRKLQTSLDFVSRNMEEEKGSKHLQISLDFITKNIKKKKTEIKIQILKSQNVGESVDVEEFRWLCIWDFCPRVKIPKEDCIHHLKLPRPTELLDVHSDYYKNVNNTLSIVELRDNKPKNLQLPLLVEETKDKYNDDKIRSEEIMVMQPKYTLPFFEEETAVKYEPWDVQDLIDGGDDGCAYGETITCVETDANEVKIEHCVYSLESNDEEENPSLIAEQFLDSAETATGQESILNYKEMCILAIANSSSFSVSMGDIENFITENFILRGAEISLTARIIRELEEPPFFGFELNQKITINEPVDDYEMQFSERSFVYTISRKSQTSGNEGLFFKLRKEIKTKLLSGQSNLKFKERVYEYIENLSNVFRSTRKSNSLCRNIKFSRERIRRRGMHESLQKLKRLLPLKDKNAKWSKVRILTEAKNYITKLNDLQENLIKQKDAAEQKNTSLKVKFQNIDPVYENLSMYLGSPAASVESETDQDYLPTTGEENSECEVTPGTNDIWGVTDSRSPSPVEAYKVEEPDNIECPIVEEPPDKPRKQNRGAYEEETECEVFPGTNATWTVPDSRSPSPVEAYKVEEPEIIECPIVEEPPEKQKRENNKDYEEETECEVVSGTIDTWTVPESKNHFSVETYKAEEPEIIERHIVQESPTTQGKLKYIPKSDIDGNIYLKPAFSYSCLIAMALKNSLNGSLHVSEIYKFICYHFPYFRTAPSGWKNSVRHNLCLNRCFIKIIKPGFSIKDNLWALNPEPAKICKLDKEIQKISERDPVAIKRAMSEPENLEKIKRGELKGDYNENCASDDDGKQVCSETSTCLNPTQKKSQKSRINSLDSFPDDNIVKSGNTAAIISQGHAALQRPDTVFEAIIDEHNYACHSATSWGTNALTTNLENITIPIFILRVCP